MVLSCLDAEDMLRVVFGMEVDQVWQCPYARSGGGVEAQLGREESSHSVVMRQPSIQWSLFCADTGWLMRILIVKYIHLCGWNIPQATQVVERLARV